MDGTAVVSSLRSLLQEYLALRRGLGYKLYEHGHQLRHFVEFVESAGATCITSELALKWATENADASRSWWTRRLDMVRGFARYCSSRDRRTQVPPSGLLPRHRRRQPPFIYRDEDIHRLLNAARKLPSSAGLRPHTFETLFGLYVATGLRTSEALHLDRDDVDLTQGVLTIRNTKFGKARYVPVHSSTRRALQRYASVRDRLCPHPLSRSFFLSDRGTRLISRTVERVFLQLCREIGLRTPPSSRRARIHDLRHRLAISTLTRWHNHRLDVERHLPTLSTYLGHVGISETQWYLTATPALLRAVLLRVGRSRRAVQS
jgi:site-specific recombinase XerD